MTRTWWIIGLAACLPAMPAQGQICSEVADDGARLDCYDRLAACVTTHDPDGRLACYDTAFAASRPLPRAAPRAKPAEEVFPLTRRAKTDEAEHVAAEIVQVQADPRGLHYLTLDNGQTWRELSKGRVRFQPGDRVELSRGVLGSVNLRVDGRSGYIKVRRVE